MESMDAQSDKATILSLRNPLYDLDEMMSNAERYEFESAELKQEKTGCGKRCLNVVIVYLIFLTGVNAFLFYEVFVLRAQIQHKAWDEKLTSTSDGEMWGHRDHDVLANTSLVSALRVGLGEFQSQVVKCEGGVARLQEELVLLNTSTRQLQGQLTTLSLTPGAPGARGPKGDPGVSGSPGEKGDQGAKGSEGAKGGPGSKGEKGSPGYAGPPGRDGTAGEKGEPGTPGLSGRIGPVGPQGQTGAKGEPGAPGQSGQPGAQGAAGLRGAQGPKGDNGRTGLTGPPGTNGQNGERGLKGDTGAKGERGSNGLTGPPGIKGDRGEKGLPGVNGIKGEKGNTGGPAVTVRLVGETSRGRVEVFHDGRWGTVCDDNFDTLDGTVICKSLGYQRANAVYTAGRGTGDIILDNLACTGKETSIFLCPHGGIGIHNCSHDEDAGVSCS